MKNVHVDLGSRAYDVKLGSGLLQSTAELIAPLLARQKVSIVTEARVAECHLSALQDSLSAAKIQSEALVLPAGESTKSWDHLQQTVEWLLDQKVERRDLVIALGGGVIGDLVGFSCAIMRRGVRFTQIPTSLLAQVDSSVGGKTGINTN